MKQAHVTPCHCFLAHVRLGKPHRKNLSSFGHCPNSNWTPPPLTLFIFRQNKIASNGHSY